MAYIYFILETIVGCLLYWRRVLGCNRHQEALRDTIKRDVIHHLGKPVLNALQYYLAIVMCRQKQNVHLEEKIPITPAECSRRLVISISKWQCVMQEEKLYAIFPFLGLTLIRPQNSNIVIFFCSFISFYSSNGLTITHSTQKVSQIWTIAYRINL